MGLVAKLMNRMNRIFKVLISLGCALAVMSCSTKVEKSEEIKKPDVVKKQAKIKSKPLRMPPTRKKIGKSIGIGIEELYALQQSGDVLIYDVRVRYFYAIDHISGAINWPHDQYDKQVQARDIEIQKAQAEGKKVVLYCFGFTCNEARNVAKKLVLRDYELYVLTMGIDSWRDAGLPLETLKR